MVKRVYDEMGGRYEFIEPLSPAPKQDIAPTPQQLTHAIQLLRELERDFIGGREGAAHYWISGHYIAELHKFLGSL